MSVDRLSTDLDQKETMVVEQKENLDTSSAYVSALEQKLRYAEKGRRDLHNTIQVRVRVRIRVRVSAAVFGRRWLPLFLYLAVVVLGGSTSGSRVSTWSGLGLWLGSGLVMVT